MLKKSGERVRGQRDTSILISDITNDGNIGKVFKFEIKAPNGSVYCVLNRDKLLKLRARVDMLLDEAIPE